MNSMSLDIHMDPNTKLLPSQGELLLDPERYKMTGWKTEQP